MPILLLVQAIFCSFFALLIIISFSSKPKIPPSPSADENLDDISLIELLKGMMKALKEIHFLILVIGFGVSVGSFYAVSTLLDQIVSPKGYSSVNTGWFGFIIVIAGIIGAFLMGLFPIR